MNKVKNKQGTLRIFCIECSALFYVEFTDKIQELIRRG
jgi:hypothetical protein